MGKYTPFALGIITVLGLLFGAQVSKKLGFKNDDRGKGTIMGVGLALWIAVCAMSGISFTSVGWSEWSGPVLGSLAVLLWFILINRLSNRCQALGIKITELQTHKTNLYAGIEEVSKALRKYMDLQSDSTKSAAEHTATMNASRDKRIETLEGKLNAVDAYIENADSPKRKEFEERLGNLLEHFDHQGSKRISEALIPVKQRLASVHSTWLKAIIVCPSGTQCNGAKRLPRNEHYYLPEAVLDNDLALRSIGTDDPAGRIYVCPACYKHFAGISADSDPRTAKVS